MKSIKSALYCLLGIGILILDSYPHTVGGIGLVAVSILALAIITLTED